MESYRIMMWFICVSSCVASAEPFILCYPLAHRKLRSLPVRIACSLFPSGDVDCTASNAFETLIPFRDQNVLFHSILCKVNFCSWLQKMSTFFFHSPYTIHGTKYDSLNIFLSWFHLIPLEFIYNSLKASSVAYCVMSISSSCTAFASFYEIPLFHCSNEKGGVLFFHQDCFFRSMNNGLFRFNER